MQGKFQRNGAPASRERDRGLSLAAPGSHEDLQLLEAGGLGPRGDPTNQAAVKARSSIPIKEVERGSNDAEEMMADAGAQQAALATSARRRRALVRKWNRQRQEIHAERFPQKRGRLRSDAKKCMEIALKSRLKPGTK